MYALTVTGASTRGNWALGSPDILAEDETDTVCERNADVVRWSEVSRRRRVESARRAESRVEGIITGSCWHRTIHSMRGCHAFAASSDARHCFSGSEIQRLSSRPDRLTVGTHRAGPSNWGSSRNVASLVAPTIATAQEEGAQPWPLLFPCDFLVAEGMWLSRLGAQHGR
jgi:hypothetical protein